MNTIHLVILLCILIVQLKAFKRYKYSINASSKFQDMSQDYKKLEDYFNNNIFLKSVFTNMDKLRSKNTTGFLMKLHSGDILDFNEGANSYEIEGIRYRYPFKFEKTEKCEDRLRGVKTAYYEKEFLTRFPIVIEEGENIALKCPHCQLKESLKQKLWFRIKHNLYLDQLVYERVIGDMHNQEGANRILITLEHDLIIKRFSNDDIGTYFCMDTELLKNFTSEIMNYFDKSYQNKTKLIDTLRNHENLQLINFYPFIHTLKLSEKIADFNGTDKELTIEQLALETLFKIYYPIFIQEKKTSDEDRVMVYHRENFELDGRLLQKPPSSDVQRNTQYGLLFEIIWSEWSLCLDCEGIENKNGYKKRHGECTVRPDTTVLKKKGSVSPGLMALYRSYPYGWPCKLRMNLKYYPVGVDIDMRDYTQYEKCSCSERNNINLAGKFLDDLSNDKLEKIKIDEEKYLSAYRKYEIEEIEGASVQLICPDVNIQSFVIWKINDLEPQVEKSHVIVDSLNVFHIPKLDPSHTAVYKCYVNDKIKAMIKLTVILKTKAIRSKEIHLWPEYHSYLYSWFTGCSALFLLIMLLKCIRYTMFQNAVRKGYEMYKSFDKNKVIEYLEINMAILVDHVPAGIKEGEKLERNVEEDSNESKREDA